LYGTESESPSYFHGLGPTPSNRISLFISLYIFPPFTPSRTPFLFLLLPCLPNNNCLLRYGCGSNEIISLFTSSQHPLAHLNLIQTPTLHFPDPIQQLFIKHYAISSISSFVFLSLRHTFSILLHAHISNACTLLSSSLLRVHVSAPYNTTLYT
jgi:hypothetical protein